jgi:hypothetical protein
VPAVDGDNILETTFNNGCRTKDYQQQDRNDRVSLLCLYAVKKNEKRSRLEIFVGKEN